MIAIQVKYIPATNTKPSKLKAVANKHHSKTLTVEYINLQLTGETTMQAASQYIAKELAKEMHIDNEMASGQLANGDYVFVLLPKPIPTDKNEPRERIIYV